MSERDAAPVDLSPAAIDRRLRELSDLLRFCLELRRDCREPESPPQDHPPAAPR